MRNLWEVNSRVGNKRSSCGREVGEIEVLRMDITTANDPNMVKCSCNNVMYMEKAGAVDYNQKDEKS